MDEELRNKLLEEVDRHLKIVGALENGSKEQQIAVGDLTKLVETINSLQETEWEFYDKQERRDLDKAKNEALAEIERKKQELSWKRVLFEYGKVFGPALLTIWAYNFLQNKVLKFEETGRITTRAGMELHLPNLPKIWK